MERGEKLRQKIPGPLACAAAVGWEIGAELRQRQPYRCNSDHPVVAVGNLQVGGTGKTPFLLWLAGHLAPDLGRAGVLSRGYGRKSEADRLVTDTDNARLVGDEPLLLHRSGLQVAVGRDHCTTLGLLQTDWLLLDDGLQQRQVRPDCKILLWDPQRKGSQHCLPRGVLRQPLSAVSQCDLIVWRDDIAPLDSNERNAASRKILKYAADADIPIARFGYGTPDLIWPEGYGATPASGRILVAAGVGRPEGVAASLRRMDWDCEILSLKDHDPWRGETLRKLLNTLEKTSCTAVAITSKDAVKRDDWDRIIPVPVVVVDNQLTPVAPRDADTVSKVVRSSIARSSNG